LTVAIGQVARLLPVAVQEDSPSPCRAVPGHPLPGSFVLNPAVQNWTVPARLFAALPAAL
jgi:hypothetical protein